MVSSHPPQLRQVLLLKEKPLSKNVHGTGKKKTRTSEKALIWFDGLSELESVLPSPSSFEET